MPELENELRTRLRQDAERVRPDVDAAWSDVSRRLGAGPRAQSRTPAWQRPWLTASVAAALLAVLAAVVLVPGDWPTTVAVGPETDSADEAGDAPDQAARMRADAPEAAAPGPTAAPSQADAAVDRAVGPFEGLFPATTWEQYGRLGGDVAANRQSWAADPEQVATRFLREVIGAEPDGQLRPIGDQVAEYEWSGGRLILWRYGPPGDPWVVTAADAAGVQVGIGDYRWMELFVGVRLERAGTVTVRTGAFDSEWVAAHTDEVPAGGTTEARLQVGREDAPGPDALLVEVRVDFADGSTAHARYRANAIGPPPGE